MSGTSEIGLTDDDHERLNEILDEHRKQGAASPNNEPLPATDESDGFGWGECRECGTETRLFDGVCAGCREWETGDDQDGGQRAVSVTGETISDRVEWWHVERACQWDGCGHDASERLGGTRVIDGEEQWLCPVHATWFDRSEDSGGSDDG